MFIEYVYQIVSTNVIVIGYMYQQTIKNFVRDLFLSYNLDWDSLT